MKPSFAPSITVVIPSFRRGEILLATLAQLLDQQVLADEIIVVDQTPYANNEPNLLALQALADQGHIDFIRLTEPSIPAAMNVGLLKAQSNYVLFLDDDINIGPSFIQHHLEGLSHGYQANGELPVAQVGQVLQPHESPVSRPKPYKRGFGLNRDLYFPFNSDSPARLANCMAGNLCVHRDSAVLAGGFDENFVGAAYRFESEFARRLTRYAGRSLQFWPAAKIDHLQWQQGGTREQASYLTSTQAAHSMGEYYYAFLEGQGWNRCGFILRRLFYSVRAKFYVQKPWYIPARIVAEVRGLLGGYKLSRGGARLIEQHNLLSKEPKARVAVLMSHPTQHFVPVYRHLHASSSVELKVFYLAENGMQAALDPGFGQELKWDIPMTQGYTFDVLEPARILKNFSVIEMDSKHTVPALKDYQPDLIWLHGYGQLANWRALLARPHGAELLYTSDSNINSQSSTWRQALKAIAVRFYLGRCDHIVSVSPSNTRYLCKFGVADTRLIKCVFPIDITHWLAAKKSLPEHSRSTLRAELGLPQSAVVFLFAGKLLAHKRAEDLVVAARQVQDQNICAIILGSGSEAESIQKLIDDSGLSERIKMTGFVNQSKLPAYFAASDVLVFPSSEEPYGTIAAEVLPFGLPIIASDKIGAIGSAIMPEQNALLYPAGDTQALSLAMRRLAVDSELRANLAGESIKVAEQHDASKFAKVIIDCTRG